MAKITITIEDGQVSVDQGSASVDDWPARAAVFLKSLSPDEVEKEAMVGMDMGQSFTARILEVLAGYFDPGADHREGTGTDEATEAGIPDDPAVYVAPMDPLGPNVVPSVPMVAPSNDATITGVPPETIGDFG